MLREHSIRIDLNHQIDFRAPCVAGVNLGHEHLVYWGVGLYNITTCILENTHLRKLQLSTALDHLVCIRMVLFLKYRYISWAYCLEFKFRMELRHYPERKLWGRHVSPQGCTCVIQEETGNRRAVCHVSLLSLTPTRSLCRTALNSHKKFHSCFHSTNLNPMLLINYTVLVHGTQDRQCTYPGVYSEEMNHGILVVDPLVPTWLWVLCVGILRPFQQNSLSELQQSVKRGNGSNIKYR